jgi:hypothetical protein
MLCIVQPIMELVWIVAVQNASETHRELTQDDEAGRGSQIDDGL